MTVTNVPLLAEVGGRGRASPPSIYPMYCPVSLSPLSPRRPSPFQK